MPSSLRPVARERKLAATRPAGDEPQRTAWRRTVNGVGGKRVLGVLLHRVHVEEHVPAVGARDRDLIARLEFTEPEEHLGASGVVDVPGQHRGPGVAGRGALDVVSVRPMAH